MKRLATVTLTVLLGLAATACGTSDSSGPNFADFEVASAVEIPGVSIPEDDDKDSGVDDSTPETSAAPATVPATTQETTATTDAPVDVPEDDSPLPTDASGMVQVVTADDGIQMALGPTDSYLAGGTFACGGRKDAEWLQDPSLFTGADLKAAYDARPKYEENDMEFWSQHWSDPVLDGMIQMAVVNPLATWDVDQNDMGDMYSSKLLAATPEDRVVRQNHTCKGDEIRRNGYLAIGEGGRFLSFAGLVVPVDELNALLAKEGMTIADLRVGVHPVEVNGTSTEYVFVEMKAVGCLNNLLKPPKPPEVPPTTTTPTTPTTRPPSTTTPSTTTPTTSPPTTVPPCDEIKAGSCGTAPPSPTIPPAPTGTSTPASTIGPSPTHAPDPVPTGPVVTHDPPVTEVSTAPGGGDTGVTLPPPPPGPPVTNPPATNPPGTVVSD